MWVTKIFISLYVRVALVPIETLFAPMGTQVSLLVTDLQTSVCNYAVTGVLEGAIGNSQRKLQSWFANKDAVGSNITGALG